MSGKSKKRRTRDEQQVAASVPDLSPDVATGQEIVPGGRPTSLGLLSADATNLSTLPEREEAHEPLASTTAAVADKYILSRIDADFIPFLLLLIACFGIAGIDNYQGKLDTGPAIRHLIWKCVTLVGLGTVVVVLYQVYRWISAKLR